MAKLDWGMLQQQFLAEHAITGISPKEWCELKELNYALRRKKNAQKSQCAIVIYPLRRVMNPVMRMMMKTPLVCAITG
ncbi:hypothetical protein [Proteus mirabilis]|uniref:hypothetical protein n=1 Tax=Proteus mirabilis TaxID=584 RepID=UPI003D02EC60